MDGNLFEELSWYTNSSELYGTQRARLLNQEQLTTGRTHEAHNTVTNYSSSSNWSIGTKQEIYKVMWGADQSGTTYEHPKTAVDAAKHTHRNGAKNGPPIPPGCKKQTDTVSSSSLLG
jgi:hypothetical protein